MDHGDVMDGTMSVRLDASEEQEHPPIERAQLSDELAAVNVDPVSVSASASDSIADTNSNLAVNPKYPANPSTKSKPLPQIKPKDKPSNVVDLTEQKGITSTLHIDTSIAAVASASNANSSIGIVEIDVIDPLKSGDGINAFVTYTVTSKRQLASGTLRHESVLRRYSDFTWLRSALVEAYPGCIVAPLPAKAVIGRFTPEFIERRRRGLAIFLQRLSKHCVLKNSKDLELFVTASEPELESHRTMKKQQSPSNAASWMGYLSSISHTVQSTFVSLPSAERSEDDMKCEAVAEYTSSLQRSISSCKTNTSAVVRGHKDLAKAWFEFGLSFTLHGQFEAKKEPQNEQALGHALAQIGQCADRISVLLSDQTEREESNFLDPLNDYFRLVEAVQEMLKGRDHALLAHRNSLENVESKRAKLESARSKGRVNKVPDLEAQLHRAEEDSRLAKEHLAKVTSSTFSEINRFRSEKERDIRAMVTDFVKLQIEYSQKMSASWAAVLDEIDKQ